MMSDIAGTLREYADAEDLSPQERITLRTAADELERLHGELTTLKAQLWRHIRMYRVDDQHPNADAKADQIMERMLAANPAPSVPDDTALLRQALEALENSHHVIEHLQDINLRRRIIDALRERLA